jgi:hypothetical protein
VFTASIPYKEAQQRRLVVVFPEAFEKPGIGEDAAPECANEGGLWEGGWLWRETE